MGKFERIRKSDGERTDEAGTVRIQLSLADRRKPSRSLRGNLTKGLSVKNTKVSEVFAAIEKALFEGE